MCGYFFASASASASSTSAESHAGLFGTVAKESLLLSDHARCVKGVTGNEEVCLLAR
jgi:hypothetical protein